MRSIEGILPSNLKDLIGGKAIDKADPFEVKTYQKLMTQVARLAYLNKDYLLFFRGQNRDYKNKAGASTFYPSIYRGDYLPQREVHYRFELLNQASKLLIDKFNQDRIDGYPEIRRKKYVQWSILQHYEVCATPLLDITHSLRVACSFAQLNNDSNYGYVYVFGMPYITNRISINSEHDLVNIRLLSICPPDALRPYFQDGYLVGTEDVTTDYDSKTELDFKNRLIAKFIIPIDGKFWGRGFSAIPKRVLYPRGDKIGKLCRSLHVTLRNDIQPGEMGQFLKTWTELEEYILDQARKLQARTFSLREAISILAKKERYPKEIIYELDSLRRFRNQLVHKPKTIEPGEIQNYINKLTTVFGRIRQKNF